MILDHNNSTRKNIYLYPKLSKYELFGLRFGGAGLGNLLFILARCIIYADQYNLKIINPTWMSIKLGPILRGELDFRTYNDLFEENFEIKGLKKYLLLITTRKVKEIDLLEVVNSDHDKNVVVECRGHRGFFSELYGYNEIIRDKIYSILTRDNIQNIQRIQVDDGIVVHIRMGDFQQAPKNLNDIQPFKNYRLPIGWYISVIDKIRSYIGVTVPVYIFSDGKDDDLCEVLDKINTHRIKAGNSISDMLALSKGSILIGSGSSFSMWSAFLGQMPSVWHPRLHPITLNQNDKIFEGEIGFHDGLPIQLKDNLDTIFS